LYLCTITCVARVSLQWTIHINHIENQTSLDSILIIKGASMHILSIEYQ
jgi:hypothetical protein